MDRPQSGQSSTRQGNGDPGATAFNYFTSQGWSPAQAAGIVGNLFAESRFRTGAVGDQGTAHGIAQWRGERQDTFRRVIGRPLQGSSFEDQLRFVDWELRNTERAAGQRLRSAQTPDDAADIFARHYERPAGWALRRSLPERQSHARSYLTGR